jgi:Fe-S oxidoreductase
MPMVGVDPALVLCYRDEYKQTLGDKRGDFHVMLVHEWLPGAGRRVQDVSGEPWYLFGHCTEVTALPGAPRSGRPFLPASARSWRASAWAAAAWPEPTGMK